MSRYFPPVRWVSAVVVIAILVVLVLNVQPVYAATITVNSDADNATAGDGLCTLREAINNANTTVDTTGGDCTVGTAGVDTISFNIGGLSAFRIEPLSPLPTITAPMIIDGMTQSSSSGTPLIQLVNTLVGIPNLTGLHVTGGGTTIRGLVISSFSANGIWLDSSNNTVERCFIGTDRSSSVAMGNTNYGVLISSATAATNNVVGSTNTNLRNVISGNGYGVGIIGATASNNTVQDSFIGTNFTGGFQVGNLHSGVFISDSPGNTIGGSGSAANLIAANQEYGVLITGSSARNNMVAGNFIGTDSNGMVALANARGGVTIDNAPNNTIGPRNVISGNPYWGIGITSAGSQGNRVISNLIGTNGAGTGKLGNQTGIYLSNASNNVIGGQSGDSNVISGNYVEGIILYPGSNGNKISGNFIGTDQSGLIALGNTVGIAIAGSSNNVVGVTTGGIGNMIAYNTGVGVDIGLAGTGNRVSGNYIHSNNNRGIDLNDDGVTLNDVGDADTGPNNLQNFPFITLATETPIIQGSLNSTPNTIFTIEFFTSNTCDSTGYGEGQYYVGSTNVTTDGTGNVSFSFTPAPGAITAGQYVTATATDPNGNTSEFSACQLVFTATTLTPGFTFTPSSTYTPSKTLSPTPTNTGTLTSTFTFTPTATSTNTSTPTKTFTPTPTATFVPTATAIPPTPVVLVSPIGGVNSETPTFIWQPPVTGPTPTWYYLEVKDGAGAIKHLQWYQASAVCTTSCTVTPDLSLPNGDYSWRVQWWAPSNPNGPWSSPGTFNVFVPPPPAVTLIAPSGTANTGNPTFTWTKNNVATWYYLEVKNSAGATVHLQWYEKTAANCPNNCAVTPSLNLPNGNYTWRVQGWDPPNIYGPWSSPVNFTVNIIIRPVTLIAPINAAVVPTGNPTFSWTKDDGATFYYLEVKNAAGTTVHLQWYQETAANCPNDCAVTPSLNLPNDTYTWRVQTWGPPNIYGPWSDPLSFTVPAPGQVTLIAPSGTINTGKPTFTWTKDGPATWYLLEVKNAANTVVHNGWYEEISANCPSNCAVTPNLNLTNGAYTWRVQTWGPPNVYGPWSAPLSFTVPGPGKVTLVAPSGTIDTSKPTFTWTKDAGATWYLLEVKSAAGTTVHNGWYEETNATCPGNTCLVTPNLNLTNGAYTWHVQTWGPPNVYGPWSDPLRFTVNVPPPPGAATLIAPVGAISSDTPTFTWTIPANTTRVYLWLNGPSGKVYAIWYNTSDICTGSTCSITPSTRLNNGTYQWWIQTSGPGGDGPWSAAQAFTVNRVVGANVVATATPTQLAPMFEPPKP